MIPFRIRVNPSSVVIPPLAFSPVTKDFTAGTASDQFVLSASGGVGQKTYSIWFGSLPSWMTLKSNGDVALATIPVSDGGNAYGAVIKAVDSRGQEAFALLTVNVGYAALGLAVGTPPQAAVGVVYPGVLLTATGGNTASYSWTITGLPPGLSAGSGTGSTRTITGTPTSGSGNTYTVTAEVTSGGQTVTRQFDIVVQAVAPVDFTVSYGTPPNATVGSPYGPVSPSVSGGTAPITYAAFPPYGFTVNASTGAIGGTPTGGYGQTVTIVVVAQDAASVVKRIEVPVTINPAVVDTLTITTPALADATPGSPYSDGFTTGSEETGTVTWAWTGNPSWLTLNPATGAVTATDVPASAANTTVGGQLTATDSGSAGTAYASWTIYVEPLAAEWQHPSFTGTFPTPSFAGGTAGSQTYNNSSYVDPGDATDATVGIAALATLPTGVTATVLDPDPVTGQFRVSYDGSYNPPSNESAGFELTVTYTEPGTTEPDPGNDFATRAVGTLYATDMKSVYHNGSLAKTITTADQLIDEAYFGAGGGTPGEPGYITPESRIFLVNDPGGYQEQVMRYTRKGTDGSTTMGWRQSSDGRTGNVYNRLYVYLSVYFPRDTLAWRYPLQSGATGTLKILNCGQYGAGQVTLFHSRFTGFLETYINGADPLGQEVGKQFDSVSNPWGRTVTLATPAIGASGSPGAFTKTAWLEHYGLLTRGLDWDMDLDYDAANPYVYARTQPSGWPDTRAATNAYPIQVDGWTAIELFLQYNPANPAAGTVQMWVAPLGSAPVLHIDEQGTVPFGANAANSWSSHELLDYDTKRQSEASRPDQYTYFGELMTSLGPIDFPGGFTPPGNLG